MFFYGWREVSKEGTDSTCDIRLLRTKKEVLLQNLGGLLWTVLALRDAARPYPLVEL